jgi:hypothetical protein
MLIAVLNSFLACIAFAVNTLNASPCTKVLTFDMLSEENKDTCIKHNARYIAKICTYPTQKDPCLHDSVRINGKSSGYLITYISFPGTMMHFYNIDNLAEHLCAKRLEPEQISNQYCCYTRTCLLFCYGIPRRKQRFV